MRVPGFVSANMVERVHPSPSAPDILHSNSQPHTTICIRSRASNVSITVPKALSRNTNSINEESQHTADRKSIEKNTEANQSREEAETQKGTQGTSRKHEAHHYMSYRHISSSDTTFRHALVTSAPRNVCKRRTPHSTSCLTPIPPRLDKPVMTSMSSSTPALAPLPAFVLQPKS